MPNIAVALNEEITRLARKEARTLMKSLRKAVAGYPWEQGESRPRQAQLTGSVLACVQKRL
jgi:hypothetical protein